MFRPHALTVDGRGAAKKTDLVKKGKTLSMIELLAIFIAFLVAQMFAGRLLTQLFCSDSVEYGDYSASSETLFQNVIAPDLVVTALIMILVVVLGWWTFVTREERRVSSWMWRVPISILAVAALTADWSHLSDEGGSYIAAPAAATLIVGFNEEFMFRGVLLHGFRRWDR
jgi:membrane protease YdiL (CAAX protease family)